MGASRPISGGHHRMLQAGQARVRGGIIIQGKCEVVQSVSRDPGVRATWIRTGVSSVGHQGRRSVRSIPWAITKTFLPV